MSQPKALWLILFLELWERFSYIGMRSLLMLYMVHELSFSASHASTVYGGYTALAYLLPVLGGLWADRSLGTRRAVTLGAWLMAAGHLCMVAADLWAFYLALALLVLGTGMFKANSASLIGELYHQDDPRRDAGFNLFYFTVNVGGVMAPLICGALAARERWHVGFGAAGVGMLLGLLVWQYGGAALLGSHGLPPRRRHATAATSAGPVKAPLSQVEWQRIWAIVVLAAVGNVSLWAALGQAGSSLALFADRETNLTLPLIGKDMPASYFQAVNPLFILLGMPLVSGAWRQLERRGHVTSPVHKFCAGLALVATGFLLMSYAGFLADAGDKVSMGWLLAATFLNTTGELCVSPVGLSLVTKLSPKRYGSGLMGLWYASIALANWCGGLLAALYEHVGKGTLFLIPASVAACSALLLLFVSRPLTRLMHGVR